MRLKTALVSLLLLCPCALCYGQLRFASVGGKGGYSAMRANYRADLDNGWILIPQYGYYRMSDKEVDQAGSTSRYGLETHYELTDNLEWLAQGVWQPRAVGYEAVLYNTGVYWEPFYYWEGIKNPFIVAKVGQARSRSYVDATGRDLADGAFHEVATSLQTALSADVKNWNLQATWQKVIKYNHRVPEQVTFSWAEVPYMTAVLQGYIEDAFGVRFSYQAPLVTPYISAVRYHYYQRKVAATAVSAGLRVKLWDVELLGGVEVFEPRREENRKTYFSLSVEMPL